MDVELRGAAGRRRSPATVPGYRCGSIPRNKGQRYPADPPRVEEIIAVRRTAGESVHGRRIRALIVILWRAGLRINEALTLAETDLEPRLGSILVRHGQGGKRHEVGMDEWGWEHLEPWRQHRTTLPFGPFPCVVDGPTRSALVADRRARRAEAPRLGRRGTPAIRAAPATPPARGRDGQGRSPPTRNPAPARARTPRRHQHLSPRRRHRRDHQRDPRPTTADDPRQRRPATLKKHDVRPRRSLAPGAPRAGRRPKQQHPATAVARLREELVQRPDGTEVRLWRSANCARGRPAATRVSSPRSLRRRGNVRQG